MIWRTVPSGTLNGLSARNIDGVLGTPRTRFYLTGDGHRNPPFAWATRPAVLQHFLGLMAAGRLCLHVEEHQDAIKAASIPWQFDHVREQNKVFGWELSIYRHLQPAMELAMSLMGDMPRPPMQDVVALDRHLIQINALAWKYGNRRFMRDSADTANEFRIHLIELARNKTQRNGAIEDDYTQFLKKFFNECMDYRCKANIFIGANIRNAIARFPNATHLITVGNAHLDSNPVQQYIDIGSEDGVIDPSQG